MSAPKARRGRTYASCRYPEAYVTWADELPDGGIEFRGESDHHHKRNLRMIARRRMI